ncbi:MAG: N-acetylneuraminate synthase [Desulfomonilaceae bacterium]
MKSVNVGTFRIGLDEPCFILAEAGVNHNGSVELAKQLVSAAVEAGADAVKFQTFQADKLVTPDAEMAEYQRLNATSHSSQCDMLKQLELTHEEFIEVKSYADTRGILFLSTPHDDGSADFLAELDLACFKIASGDVTNIPFLRRVALKGKPVILSTGMAYFSEVEAAVRTIEEAGNTNLILLHCVSNYPAKPASCNLRAMDTLAHAFGYPVGFSDHTLGCEVTLAAVARGARLIEKHLTLDKAMHGPDHKASSDPIEFSAMVRAVRVVEAALGDGVKEPVASELDMRVAARKSVVAARPIPAGRTIVAEDLALRRSPGELDSAYMDLIIGRKVRQDLDVNSVITLDLLV